MTTYVSVGGLQPHQIWGGVVARPLHGERLTVGILDFEPLTHVPEHRHDNDPDEVFINLVEVQRENWSFEKGVAQFVPQAETK